MFLARFSTKSQREIDLTNAFYAFFATIRLSYAPKSTDSLGNSAWGAWGARARQCADSFMCNRVNARMRSCATATMRSCAKAPILGCACA